MPLEIYNRIRFENKYLLFSIGNIQARIYHTVKPQLTRFFGTKKSENRVKLKTALIEASIMY